MAGGESKNKDAKKSIKHIASKMTPFLNSYWVENPQLPAPRPNELIVQLALQTDPVRGTAGQQALAHYRPRTPQVVEIIRKRQGLEPGRER